MSGRWIAAAAALALAFGSTGLAAAQAPSTPDPLIARADYANPSLWLCRPGLASDACKVDLDATVIKPNGKTKVERFKAAKAPDIDCFFVYPTVSLDPGYLSDWTPDKMETDDIRLQFARFASTCRTFAPLYRQFTLTALRAAAGGPAPAGERPPANVGGYQDVSDAFAWYMANENKGRGVVLIGHSQGAGLIARLIANEIEGKPVEKTFVSGIILGSAVLVPQGADVGGTFKTIPLCRNESQTGCVLSYATFRDTLPPPEASRFGRGRDNLVAACTNPANLLTGKGEPDSYFLTSGFLNGSGGATQPAWASPAPTIRTPFVKTPGLVTTTCVTRGPFSYLEMHVNADPSDRRTDELAGEVQRATGPDLAWGLHLIDVDHSMGDLIRIVKAQGKAFVAKRPE